MNHQNQSDEFRIKISILHKIVFYATLLVFIAVGISTYLALKTESEVLKEELIYKAKYLTKDIGSSTRHAFSSLNWIFVEKMLKELLEAGRHEVIYAKVVNHNGEVYLASDRSYYGERVDSSLLSDKGTLLDNYFFPQQKEYGILSIHPITISNERWHIILGLSLKSVKEAVRSLIVRNLAFGGLIVLLGIIGSLFLSRSISRPIINLANAAKIITSGNWDHNVGIKSKDEVGLLGYSFNQMINSLKLGENALKESEEKYRTILESIEEGYYEVDLAGKFTFFNDSICKILGYSKDELMGMNNQQYTDKETAKKVYETYNKVYTTGKPAKGFEYEFIRKDGNKGHIESSVSLMKDAEGKPIGFRGIAHDISERKQAEKLQQEKIKAEAASRAKSEFLANMSHEIRTPLNGIIGMAELALDSDIDDNQRNIFHTINTEANSLLFIINDILDFSKVESGKLELEEIPFDLRHVIEDVSNSFANSAEQKGLEFISFLSPDIPSRLIGDPGRLRQVLINLSDNALKFTNEGEIYIKGEMAEDLGEKVKIRFLVKDTGIGIPKDKQATIFDSFTQADGSTTRRYGGTGLGITISKQLVEMMGGEIGVESEEGKGSTFYFTALFNKQTGQEAILAKDFDLSNLKVLVVDDNQTNRYILTEYLSSWGCLPVEASGGKEALSILRHSVSSEEPFNLILTDFQMPEMSGFDLAKEIRAIGTLKGVPIIVLTSVGTRGDSKSCRDIGINGYLAKPIRRDDLHMALISVLGLSTAKEVDTSPKLVTRHSIAEDSRKEFQILLAEDYPTNQQVAMRHLNKAGYQVELAENGKQAVEAYKRKGYDLILMDIQMPVMDGYEATREIRKLEALAQTAVRITPGRAGNSKPWPRPDLHGLLQQDSLIKHYDDISNNTAKSHQGGLETGKPEDQVSPLMAGSSTSFKFQASRIPIVAMTAHATKGVRERCLKAGMDDYIAKPLRRKELLAMVDNWTKPNADFGLRPPAQKGLRPGGKADLKSLPATHPSRLKAHDGGPVASAQARRLPATLSLARRAGAGEIQNPKSKIENAPMNFKRAIEEFEGDKEFLMEVLEGFLENVRAQIGTIRQAISDGDAEVVRGEAHSIKGGAANLTADELSRIAFELENIGKSGALEEGIGCLERLEKEFYRLEGYVRNLGI